MRTYKQSTELGEDFAYRTGKQGDPLDLWDSLKELVSITCDKGLKYVRGFKIQSYKHSPKKVFQLLDVLIGRL